MPEMAQSYYMYIYELFCSNFQRIYNAAAEF